MSQQPSASCVQPREPHPGEIEIVAPTPDGGAEIVAQCQGDQLPAPDQPSAANLEPIDRGDVDDDHYVDDHGITARPQQTFELGDDPHGATGVGAGGDPEDLVGLEDQP